MSASLPSVHAPAANYPGRPYDWAAPYDWDMEEVFAEAAIIEEAEAPDASSYRFRKDVANTGLTVGAVALTGLALAVGAHEVKSRFFNMDARPIPPELPAKVGETLASAVKVEYNYDLHISSEGSGVKVGPDLVLTAGHVIKAGNPHNVLECDGSYVMGEGERTLDWAGQIVGQRALYRDGHDVAVVKIQRTHWFDALPAAKPVPRQPRAGEPLFFINYETSAQPFSERYPSSGLAGLFRRSYEHEPNVSDARFYGHPAEYAGTVVGHEGSDLVVATGAKSYGSAQGSELDTHPGASGGPVFDSEGGLIGEVVARQNKSSSTTSIGWNYSINLPGPSKRSLSMVQPVTESMITSLAKALPQKPAC